MRIGIIDVTNLIKVRKTFHPAWRIIVALLFLFFACFWWAAIHQIESLEDLYNIRIRTLVMAVILLSVTGVALARKDYFSRLFFALVSIFVILMMLLILVFSIYGVTFLQGNLQIFLALFFIACITQLSWQYLVSHSYALCTSVFPFKRWKAYRQQVVCSLRLWSGHWKAFQEPERYESSEQLRPEPGDYLRLAVAWLAFVVGLISLSLVIPCLINVDFFPAFCRGDFSRVWSIIRTFQIKDKPFDFWGGFFGTMSFFIAAMFNFFVFGFFRDRWQRRKIQKDPRPISQHITPSSLLLLRASKDDAKFLPGMKYETLLFPFKAFSWGFTFEQLIVDRLTYLGEVRALVADDENSKLPEGKALEILSRLPFQKKLTDLISSIRHKFWYEQPLKGAIRHVIKAGMPWENEILKSLPTARMIIVILGISKSLSWEIQMIKEMGFLEKTVFLMPPLFPKNSRKRWGYFVNYVCDTEECKEWLLKNVKPKQILAVYVREDELVTIIGNSNQWSYESALDLATILAVAESAQSGKMIPKYVA